VFVHLGGDVVVDARDVVAVLDAQGLRPARALPGRAAPRWNEDISASARALVVTTSGVYAVPISPSTVVRRIARLSSLRGPLKAER
jgi:hypothetical protein